MSGEVQDWYGVRSVVRHPGVGTFEERITLWRATSLDEAMALAEAESAEYADTVDAVDTGLYQAYVIGERPRVGAEVFSLMRTSTLDADDYLDRFFDTGAERQAT